jgi:hypothetical protein
MRESMKSRRKIRESAEREHIVFLSEICRNAGRLHLVVEPIWLLFSFSQNSSIR